VSEPWRNGYIEKFNDTLDKNFFRKVNFENFNQFCKDSDEFIEYHNNNYRYSPLGGKTPN